MGKKKERRQDKRIPLTEAGFLINKDNGQKLIPVKISDVSFNGVGIVADSNVRTDDEYLLKYSIFHRSFSFPIKIAWMHLINSKFFLGCHKKPTI